jgi:hypothetical protein
MWGSFRITVEGEDIFAGQDRPCVVTLWHDSLFVVTPYLARMARGATLRPTYLVSPSRDGDLGVALLDRLGVRTVRGSATRSGVSALHGLYRAMVREGASPVVLPDGPQGPPHHCKAGPVLLGQLAGAPVVPVACAARPRWRLGTWDRQLVPWPFARVAIVVGVPRPVPRELSPEQLEQERGALEASLEEMVGQAEALLDGAGQARPSR